MTIVSRSPKTWPYAQHSAQDSIGKLLGTLHPGLLGDILCWEAKGEARRLFESSLKKSILDYLLEHSDKAQESGSYLSIPLFMVGKRAKRAKPVVMLVSDDKVARKEAYDLILHSDIMTKYPGFELGHSDFEKLMAWAGDSVSVFSLQQEGASDCYQLISGKEVSEKEVSGRRALPSAALGAFGTESIKRARNVYGDRSGDGDISPDHPSTPKKGLGIAAAALAVAGVAKYLQASKVEKEERHRGRSRSRGQYSSGDDYSSSRSHSRSRSRSPRRKRSLSPLAKAAVGTAAVAGLVQHFRNKSRTRSRSRSKSRYGSGSHSKSTLKRSLSTLAKADSIRTATAGGVVSYMGKHMLLSVNHFLRDSPSVELPAPKAEASQISDCEITGLGDFDDDDDDETDTEFVETVRQGSVSDVDESKESEMEDSYTPTSASESDRNSQRRLSISPQEPSSPEGRLIGKGNPVVCGEELDYALFEVTMISPSESLLNNAISLTDLDKIESHPRKAAVRTVSANGRVVHGLMSEDTLTVRLPHSKEFIEVYTARFFGSLGPGDCGSWVKDKATGCLFGHVFAGNLSNGLTAIMPAKRVFEHARALLDRQFALQSLDDDDDSTYGSAVRKAPPNFAPKVKSNLFGPKAPDTVEQAKFIKKFVCRDPNAVGLYSDAKPDYPLSQCPECSSGKKYNAYYMAVDHLRRRHFKRHYQGTIVNSNSRVVRLSSAIADLRLWAEEVFVKADEPLGSSSAEVAQDEASLSTGKAPPTNDVNPSAPSLQPLTNAHFPHSSIHHAEPLASLYQSWNIPLPGLSFSPHSMSTATPSSTSNSPYQLYNVNSYEPPPQFQMIQEALDEVPGSTSDSFQELYHQVYNIDPLAPTLKPLEVPSSSLVASSAAYAPEIPAGSDYPLHDAYFSPLTSPALTSSELPSVQDAAMKMGEGSSSGPLIIKPRQAIASRSSGRQSGRSSSDQRRKSSKFLCTICNDHPSGFRGPHELDRHMLRHNSNKTTKKFICRDPASVGIKADVQAINPLSKCESCSAQKRYASADGAIAHLYIAHMRDPSTGKSHAVKGKRPLTDQLKDWCCEVEVDGHERILTQAGGKGADAGSELSEMDCDDDNEDTVMTSDIPELSGSPHAGAGGLGFHEVVCSNCSTQNGLVWGTSPEGQSLCEDCRNLPTCQDSVRPSYPKTALLSSTSVAARNSQESNAQGKSYAIRKPFASIANVVKNRLLPRSRLELDHTRNGGGPTAEAGRSQITSTTDISATSNTGVLNNSNADDYMYDDLWGPNTKALYARLASIGRTAGDTVKTSVIYTNADSMSISSMGTSDDKTESSHDTAIAPFADHEVSHIGPWAQDKTRKPFASITNVVKNRLLPRSQPELDHARNGGGPTAETGRSQTTDITDTSAALGTGGINDINDVDSDDIRHSIMEAWPPK